MKKLSIEEKAKRYDEAIERANSLLSGNQLGDAWIYKLLPELKESEDERIIKGIKSLLEWNKEQGNVALPYPFVTNDEALAWLEKQDEQKLTNPAKNCKDEPKFKVKYAGSEYNVFEIKELSGITFYGIEDEPSHIDYVKADNCEIISGGYGIKENGSPYPTKPAKFSEQNSADITDEWIEEYWQHEKVNNPYSYNKGDEIQFDYQGFVSFCKKYCQKPVWSEEEVEIIDWLVASFDCLKIPTDTFYQSKVRPFLISLRNKIQPIINEWSEEDCNQIETIACHLDNIGNGAMAELLLNIMNKYKSCKPQNTWKPSDEQMKALSIAMCGVNDPLFSLYQDLLKLKE